ncbi:MDR family MFS transporter [Kineosporia babensis]|uniref:DHA2 family efflux MFS transporter permease subunit n=1 Tax=Kineosporia babensis TaxID=499548 RepID=A0A9X1T4H4_9ACTN|nr:MDR family MFS transporter [Kineosporia babensis]MCD5316618.1 DHA2 family efflux MFS transporter permease subunit [Kineosporia babensis]
MTTPAPARTEVAAEPAPRTGPALSVLMVAAFVGILNETVMGLALPQLMADLNVSAANGQWLTTGYMLTMAVVIPASGFLLQRFHARSVFLAATGLFTLGTLLAALAPGFALLLVGRVVQALGAAVLMPLLLNTVMHVVPAHQRGRVMARLAIVLAVAPVVGPVSAGLLLSALGWRWIFIVMLPIALICVALGTIWVRDLNTPRRVHLDLLSVVLSALAFGGLIFGLALIGESASGHAPVPVSIPLVIGLLALAAFAWRQILLARTDRALLDLRIFTYAPFTISVLATLAAFSIMFGVLIMLPLYLQQVTGLTPFTTGLLMIPGGAIQVLAAPFIGRLYDRHGPRPLVIPGGVLLSAALWSMSTLNADSAPATAIAMYVLMSLALSLLISPLFTTALSSVRPQLYSHASAAASTIQQLGGAAGTALFITMLTIGSSAHTADATASTVQNTVEGTQAAFAVGGIAALVVLAFTLFVRRPNTAPSETVAAH